MVLASLSTFLTVSRPTIHRHSFSLYKSALSSIPPFFICISEESGASSLRKMMNLCAIQQKAFSSMEETERSVSRPVSDRRYDDLFCPKPRRFNILTPSMNEQPCRPLRRDLGHHTDSELCDSKTGIDLLDILLLKGGIAGEQSFAPLDSSPLFTCESPPRRVPNPLIRDVRFGVEKVDSFIPQSPVFHPIPNQSLTSSPARNRRSNFGHSPGVRVEGFDCLERERGNCSIPTFA